jgi:hypothetical protein
MNWTLLLLVGGIAIAVFRLWRKNGTQKKKKEEEGSEDGTQPPKKSLTQRVKDGEIDLLGNIHIFVCVVWYLVIVLVLAPDIGGSGYWDWLSTGPKGVYLFLGLIFTWGFSSREPWTIWVYGLLMITTLALLGLSIWL